MKRNLVSYERFEQMKANSLSTVVNELIEAQDHLARTLGTASLVLESFDDTKVIYQKEDGTFVKADYSVEGDAVNFDNLEELVIDEASETAKRKELVGKMLEAILEDKEAEAHTNFERYMELASQKHKREGTLLPQEGEALDESYARLYGTRGKAGKPKEFVRRGAKDPKKSAAAKKAHRLHGDSYKIGGRKRHANLHKERTRRPGYAKSYARLHALSGGKQYGKAAKHMNEWLTLANNVFQYAEFLENGHVLSESVVRTDASGEVTGVKLPSSKARNEGKIIKMHYDRMIKQDSPKVMRENALRLGHNPKFASAVAELKRHNNLSDNEGLEETLNQIVAAFPSVMYLSQEELAKSIGFALESAGVTQFSDQHCVFMAEGLLRTAVKFHEEKVGKLVDLAKVEAGDDSFKNLAAVAANYFPTLDEAIQTEFKVFEDLYNAVLDVRRYALESNNEEVRSEANDLVGELESVLKGEVAGNIDLAVEVAEWLNDIAEANVPGSSETWTVVKTPHHTVTGDHPQMNKNAKVDATASKYNGDWDDSAPMISQGNMKYNHANAEEARNRSWGNKGGKDVWPSLSNPNVPKSPWDDYKINGETPVGSDDEWGHASGDTWPSLQNPYIPKALIPKQTVDPSGKLD